MAWVKAFLLVFAAVVIFFGGAVTGGIIGPVLGIAGAIAIVGYILHTGEEEMNNE